MKHFILSLAVASGLMFSSAAFCDSDAIFSPESDQGEEPVQKKALVVVAPEALGAMTQTAAGKTAIGQNAWLALSLHAGSVTGPRAVIIPYHSGNMSIAVEGIFGMGINPASGIRETFGGGARVSFTLASDGENDALLLSPGVDILFANGTPGRGLAEYSSYGHVYFVAAGSDISWVHQIYEHFGWELGARVGAAVVINEGDPKTSDTKSLRGTPVPDVGIFTGVRF